MKSESTPKLYQLWSVPITGSGIKIELWSDKLISVHAEADQTEGTVICDTEGYLMSNTAMNELLWATLKKNHFENPDSFHKDIRSVNDVQTHINIYRSLWRSHSWEDRHWYYQTLEKWACIDKFIKFSLVLGYRNKNLSTIITYYIYTLPFNYLLKKLIFEISIYWWLYSISIRWVPK